MKIERTRNAGRNLVFGWALKLYQILIPFLMRTAMIYYLGMEYTGLNNLFASVLQVLNLAELGVGSAMIYSMYKPIARDQPRVICALLNLYRTYYRLIGLAVAVIGLCLTPFIPHLIHGTIPGGMNVYVLYLLNLAATVLSYWLFAYKNSILLAHQRVDVISKVTLLTNTVQYILQFLVLFLFHNYYAFLILALLSQAATNLLSAWAADRMYPQYQPEGKLSRKATRRINHRIRDLFTAKVGATIVNSADTLVISAFLGLTVLAIYTNYYFILTSITGLIAIIFNACSAGIGNSLVTETKQKNFQDLQKFTFLICWIAGFCSCCLLCLYQPFMAIWVGEEMELGFSAVICFCLYFYVYEINQLLNGYKDAAGIWHEDRFRPLVTAGTNLGLNLLLVQVWGIYGVLLSTVISTLFVGMPWLLHNLFTVLFDPHQLKGYLKQLLGYALIVLLSWVVCGWLCSFINPGPWATLIIRLLICCIVPNAIYLLVYHRTAEFGACLILVDNLTKNKLQLRKRLAFLYPEPAENRKEA